VGSTADSNDSTWTLVRDAYFTFDRRTLGFTRIMLGWLLLTDLLRRTYAWNEMFSDEGVVPAYISLARPQSRDGFSIVNAFTSPSALAVLWVVIFISFFCVLIGYRTRLAQVLSLLFLTSMNGRVLLIENGGYIVQNLLLLWTLFLPLGDRFSVDAVLASMRKRREANAKELNDREHVTEPFRLEPHVSLVGLAILLQLSALYYFNVVHKTGTNWRNGTAVHYVLYVDRMVTPIVAQLRDHVPWIVYIAMTKTVLAIEAALPVCLLSPLGRVWARRLAIAMMCFLHIGFGSSFVLGPFAWSLCVFSTLLFNKEDWDLATRTMKRAHRARTVVFDSRSATALWVCRLLARLDRFVLLRFQERPQVPGRLAVLDRAGEQRTHSDGFAQALRALPLGPAFAWVIRVPGIRESTDAAWRALDGRASAFFGARKPTPNALTEAPPSAMRRRGRKALIMLRELCVVAMFLAAINQALVELWSTKTRWRMLIADLNKSGVAQSVGIKLSAQPAPLRILAGKLRFLQGWFMFSPNPVMNDGTVVVDAITIDGRHIDPFTGEAPNFDLLHANSFGYSQIWSDYYNRIQLPQNRALRDAAKMYMHRLPERTGNPNDELVSGDFYWVKDMNPKWGSRSSWKLEKVKLFSFREEHKPASVRSKRSAESASPLDVAAPTSTVPAGVATGSAQTPRKGL